MRLAIRRLAATDIIDGFSAGASGDEEKLTTFFRTLARQQQRRRQSSTWLAVDEDNGQRIVGFATTCPGGVAPNDAVLAVSPHVSPYHPIPILLIARMACAADCKRIGIGTALLQFARERADGLAAEHGCVGLVTEAKVDAVGFYEGKGFVRIGEGREGRPIMFWPLPRKK